MSAENVEVVRRIWRHWTRGAESGDPGALRAPFDEGLLSPESSFTPIQEVPGRSDRPYVGLDGLREFVRAWAEDWAEWKIELEEVIDADDDHVVVGIHQSAIGKGSGAAVDLRFAMVFTFEDGQVVDRQDHPTLDDALEALGRRE